MRYISSKDKTKSGVKAIVVLLIIALFIITFSSVAPGAPEVLYGDVDENGRINVKDVTLLMKYILELEDLTASQLEAADVNGDGKIDVKDVTLIMQYVLELIDDFPILTKIASVEDVEITVNRGTALEDIDFPDTVETTLYNDDEKDIDVEWSDTSDPEYDSLKMGKYEFEGDLVNLPLGVTNPENITATATVTVRFPPYPVRPTPTYYKVSGEVTVEEGAVPDWDSLVVGLYDYELGVYVDILNDFTVDGVYEFTDVESGEYGAGKYTVYANMGGFRHKFSDRFNVIDADVTGVDIELVEDLSGFEVADPGPQTTGVEFYLEITGATDYNGDDLTGDINVIVESDEDGNVFNDDVNFIAGAADVPITLTAVATHELTIDVAYIPDNVTITVEVQEADPSLSVSPDEVVEDADFSQVFTLTLANEEFALGFDETHLNLTGDFAGLDIAEVNRVSETEATVEFDGVNLEYDTGTGTIEVTAGGLVGDDALSVDVTVLAIALAHDVEGDEHNFVTLLVGYEDGDQEVKEVTVTATGDHTNVEAGLSGVNAGSFVLTDDAIGTLAHGETATFEVAAVDGLSIGDYTASVTITSDQDTTGASFEVNQAVVPLASSVTLTGDEILATDDSAVTGEYTAALDQELDDVEVLFTLSGFDEADIVYVSSGTISDLLTQGVTVQTNGEGEALLYISFAAGIDKTGELTAAISDTDPKVGADDQDTLTITVDTTPAPEPGSISGTINLVNGTADMDVDIQVSANGEDTTVTIATGQSSADYEIDQLAAGEYDVSAEVTGDAEGQYVIVTETYEDLIVAEGETTENIDFDLQKVVVDPDNSFATWENNNDNTGTMTLTVNDQMNNPMPGFGKGDIVVKDPDSNWEHDLNDIEGLWWETLFEDGDWTVVSFEDDNGVYTVVLELVEDKVPFNEPWDIEVNDVVIEESLDIIITNIAEGDVYNLDKDETYASISLALDDAEEDNTILVGPGTFNENAVINIKGLTLRSAEKHGARIEGYVDINATEVTVEGFHIIRESNIVIIRSGAYEDLQIINNIIDGEGNVGSIGVLILSSAHTPRGATIQGNTFEHVNTGIKHAGSTGTWLIDNNVFETGDFGYRAEEDVGNWDANITLTNNTVRGESRGISIEIVPADVANVDLTIENNTFEATNMESGDIYYIDYRYVNAEDEIPVPFIDDVIAENIFDDYYKLWDGDADAWTIILPDDVISSTLSSVTAEDNQDGSALITFTVKNQFGDPVTGLAETNELLAFGPNESTTIQWFIDDPDWNVTDFTYDGDGVYTFNLHHIDPPQTRTWDAWAWCENMGDWVQIDEDIDLVITIPVVDGENSSAAWVDNQDGTGTMTLTVRDQHNDPMPDFEEGDIGIEFGGTTRTLSELATLAGWDTVDFLELGDGIYEILFDRADANTPWENGQEWTIYVDAEDIQTFLVDDLEITIPMVDAENSSVTASDNGDGSALITFTVKDQFGDPVTGLAETNDRLAFGSTGRTIQWNLDQEDWDVTDFTYDGEGVYTYNLHYDNAPFSVEWDAWAWCEFQDILVLIDENIELDITVPMVDGENSSAAWVDNGDGTGTMTLTVHDQHNDPMPDFGMDDIAIKELPDVWNGTLSDLDALGNWEVDFTNNNDGTYTVILDRDDGEYDRNWEIKVDDVVIEDVLNVVITYDPEVDAGYSGAGWVDNVDGTGTMTVTTHDQYDNPITGFGKDDIARTNQANETHTLTELVNTYGMVIDLTDNDDGTYTVDIDHIDFDTVWDILADGVVIEEDLAVVNSGN